MAVAAPVWSEGVIVVGKVLVDGVELDVKRIALNFASTDGNPKTLIVAVPGKKIRVLAFVYWVTINAELEWRSNTTVLLPPVHVLSRETQAANLVPGFFLETAVGEALTMRQQQVTQANVRGSLVYVEV